jgi:hypothetical protein
MRAAYESQEYTQGEPPVGSIDLVAGSLSPVACRRSSPRRPVRWNAVAYYCGGPRGVHVIVRNVSRGGMMLENAFGAMQADRMRVVLLSGRAFEGEIMWTVAPYCGFRFDAEVAENDPIMGAK